MRERYPTFGSPHECGEYDGKAGRFFSQAIEKHDKDYRPPFIDFGKS
jgi:hypothetical protein